MPKAAAPSESEPLSLHPAFATINDWCRLSGMSRRVTYEELAAGNLRAVKRGKTTLIDAQHGLAYLRSLPPWVPDQNPRPRKTRSGQQVSG